MRKWLDGSVTNRQFARYLFLCYCCVPLSLFLRHSYDSLVHVCVWLVTELEIAVNSYEKTRIYVLQQQNAGVVVRRNARSDESPDYRTE